MKRFILKTLLALAVLSLSLPVASQGGRRQAKTKGKAATVVAKDTVEGLLTLSADLLSATDSLPYPQNICARLDSLLQSPMLKRTQLGLMVFDLTADSAICRFNHRQTLRPASTMKLLTAITAISQLGGSYQLRTSLYYTGSIADGILTGDLYCVGGMDPMFDDDDMAAFAAYLRRLDVDTIRGRIVCDRSFKVADIWGEGWCWDDDNPVLSPLLINRKDDFAASLRLALAEQGTVVSGGATEGRLPAGAVRVCTRSHSIDQVLMTMMKESDNLYAEAMFYQIAAAEGQRPAKAAHARNAIKRMIQKVGLRPSDYRIADGSGLSLYNYVSAELETRLLRYAWRNTDIFEILFPTLPVAAVDGTLKSRLDKTAAADNVSAKTGTVSGISSLAGYCTAANGHELCFCIINQGVMRSQDGRQFQDQVCRALCEP